MCGRPAGSISNTAPTAGWSTAGPGGAGRGRDGGSETMPGHDDRGTMTATPDLTSARFDPEPGRFRQVLGHFCTGVTVITTVDDGEPAGFACQSFAALSLGPPLVLFCPSQ